MTPRMRSIDNIKEVFAYASEAVADVARRELGHTPGARVFDLSFPSPAGGRVTAYLVLPQAGRPPPVIVFHHWGFGSRSSFLSEARAYAEIGVASLLVDAPHMGSRGRGLPPVQLSEVAINYLKTAVTDVRRALDVLDQSREVDGARTVYVGHSLGGAFVGHLAAVEPRFRGLAAMAGPPRISRTWSPRPNPKYRDTVEPYDGENFIGFAERPILLQFGKSDRFVPEREAQRLVRAAPEGATVHWYDAGHALNAEALTDRSDWLLGVLGHQARPTPHRLRRVSLPRRERVAAVVGEHVYAALLTD